MAARWKSKGKIVGLLVAATALISLFIMANPPAMTVIPGSAAWITMKSCTESGYVLKDCVPSKSGDSVNVDGDWMVCLKQYEYYIPRLDDDMTFYNRLYLREMNAQWGIDVDIGGTSYVGLNIDGRSVDENEAGILTSKGFTSRVNPKGKKGYVLQNAIHPEITSAIESKMTCSLNGWTVKGRSEGGIKPTMGIFNYKGKAVITSGHYCCMVPYSAVLEKFDNADTTGWDGFPGTATFYFTQTPDEICSCPADETGECQSSGIRSVKEYSCGAKTDYECKSEINYEDCVYDDGQGNDGSDRETPPEPECRSKYDCSCISVLGVTCECVGGECVSERIIPPSPSPPVPQPPTPIPPGPQPNPDPNWMLYIIVIAIVIILSAAYYIYKKS
jgi:hypothetical protein